MLIAIIAAIISCIPFFARYEKKKSNTREIVILAVMIALCFVGRFIFTFIPHFKPVTALIIITGIYFGTDAGFITGALTAIVSNMQYGQGPWTVFQMVSWGLIGFMAGFLQKKGILKNKLILLIFSGISGIVFSMIMDIYTTLSMDSSFSIVRYFSYVAFAIPVMIEYCVSNIIFMLLLEKPIGKKLSRIKIKYDIFNE
ncbi:MAG: ECF transporter S component [Clostridia bacterium]